MRVYNQAPGSSHDLLLLSRERILGAERELVHELFVRRLQPSNVPIRVELSFVEVSDEEAVRLWHATVTGLHLFRRKCLFRPLQHRHFVGNHLDLKTVLVGYDATCNGPGIVSLVGVFDFLGYGSFHVKALRCFARLSRLVTAFQQLGLTRRQETALVLAEVVGLLLPPLYIVLFHLLLIFAVV